MLAKYILAALAILFLTAGAVRRGIQGRTWLLIGAIFLVVSASLFLSGS